MPLGASRLGGSPDLPKGFDWPLHRGRPLTFLAQFDLSEVRHPALPGSGWLLFFYDVAEQPRGFDPLHRGGARVIHVDVAREALERVVHPDVWHAGGPYEPCSVVFKASKADLSTQPQHHLFGEPQLLDGDLWGTCQLASHGIYCGDSSGYGHPGAVELLEKAADEWLLLLQLDSDAQGPDFCWEDDGRVYFSIRTSDLQMGIFDQAWLVLQTTLG